MLKRSLLVSFALIGVIIIWQMYPAFFGTSEGKKLSKQYAIEFPYMNEIGSFRFLV